MRKVVVAVALSACATLVAAIGVAATTGSVASGSGGIDVVAGEDMWGSIAAQVGGGRVHVSSVVANPATDPHDYEPTAADARAVAVARLVLENGVGYDPWLGRLADASPLRGRIVLDVGKLAGVEPGGNPHRWYSPADVHRVVAALVAGYARLDPRHAEAFRRSGAAFERRDLAGYRRLVATIRTRYRGVAVGASESVFEPLAAALGLRLATPRSFLKAISEGSGPTAADVATVDRQIARREVRVWVVNAQNQTPDVSRVTAEARRHGIPVVAITETLVPATATFQAWQTRQLEALARALREATGR